MKLRHLVQWVTKERQQVWIMVSAVAGCRTTIWLLFANKYHKQKRAKIDRLDRVFRPSFLYPHRIRRICSLSTWLYVGHRFVLVWWWKVVWDLSCWMCVFSSFDGMVLSWTYWLVHFIMQFHFQFMQDRKNSAFFRLMMQKSCFKNLGISLLYFSMQIIDDIF